MRQQKFEIVETFILGCVSENTRLDESHRLQEASRSMCAML